MFFGDEKNNMQEGNEVNFNEEEAVTWEDVLNADEDDDLVPMGNNPGSSDEAPLAGNSPDSDFGSDDLDGDVSDEELARILNSSDGFDDDDNSEEDAFAPAPQPQRQEVQDDDILQDSADIISMDGDDDTVQGYGGNDDSVVGYNEQGISPEAPKRKTYNIPKQNTAKQKEKPKSSKTMMLALLVLVVFLASYCYFTMFSNKASQEPVAPMAPESEARSADSEIPIVNEEEVSQIVPDQQEEQTEKTEVVVVQQTGRANPFMPLKKYAAVEIPNVTVDYSNSLIPDPPARYGVNDEKLDKMVSIAVSGIMYDEQKPSAIITFDDNDYFVQIGDRLDDYKVVEIAKSYVVLAMGKNTYKANIGEEFKVNEFYGNAKYLPSNMGGGRQYYSVQENREEPKKLGSQRYVSEDDVEIKAK